MHKQKATMVGNPVKVDVYAKINQSTRKVEFTDDWEADWSNGKQKGRIDIPPGTNGADIHFHLHDETGLHLKFYKSFGDAMYVSTGTTCPPPKGNQGGQISLIECTNHLLKVHNANSGDPIVLKYALRFQGRDNTEGGEWPPYVYDPDIKNGGGGIGGFSNSMYLLIGGAAVVAVAYIAYLAFYK